MSVDFSMAAKQNGLLSKNLRWKWSKQQKGWYLYAPLMKQALKTEAAENSQEFAQKIAEWQKEANLETTGIVDTETLLSFIEYWQSRRIKPVYEAEDSQLLSAPIEQFYDPTRGHELLKVDTGAHAAYLRMIEDAKKELGGEMTVKRDPRYLKIISSYRSPAYQAELRAREPGATTAQIAIKSAHFTGRALDIFVGFDPVSTQDYNRAKQIKTPEYLWMVENAEKYGFYPYFYEPWHWEYVGIDH